MVAKTEIAINEDTKVFNRALHLKSFCVKISSLSEASLCASAAAIAAILMLPGNLACAGNGIFTVADYAWHDTAECYDIVCGRMICNIPYNVIKSPIQPPCMESYIVLLFSHGREWGIG